jgi:hypothetical protein
MRKTYTLALTVFAAVLCLVHYIGHESDPVYLIFYALSVPAWFAPAFGDITRINIAAVYLLTIASYAFIGYVIDYFIARNMERRGAD